ncbi:ribulose kinase [Ensifer sp. WSM1721]|uniref:FGGY-family carbohydrate kinase n=1 Tax=Ensifer sp. WSM1721 TaxID=1041159 RepID=UPI0004B8DE98
MDTQTEAGAPVERVVISGGAGQHDLVRQILADACGKPVVATRSEEPVLHGSAILGSVASGAVADTGSASRGHSPLRRSPLPAPCRDRAQARLPHRLSANWDHRKSGAVRRGHGLAVRMWNEQA